MSEQVNQSITITDEVRVGVGPLPTMFSGPCVIESQDHALRHASRLQELMSSHKLPFVFKASYDKANRTSASSFRGPGMEEGLRILEIVRSECGVPVISDVHSPSEARAAAEVLDVLQIPAFLCRQTDLLVAAAKTGKPVFIKKGQFVAPGDMAFAVDKIVSSGNPNVMLCERGACFGYRQLVVDFRGIDEMRAIGCPVVFDGTHSVQEMGGAGGVSGGNRQHVAGLVRAALAVGVDGVFLECHERPDEAPSDGPNMLPLDLVPALLHDIRVLAEAELQTRVRPAQEGGAR